MTLLPHYRRTLLRAAGIAAVLSVIAILAIDGRVAVALSDRPSDDRYFVGRFVGVCEVLFAFRISPYLYGASMVILGLIGLCWPKRGVLPWALLFIGLSHVTGRFLADILKPPFSRLRPFEALGTSGWHDTWFAAVGNSFPSGHAVHFWSLFFPLVVLFPRYSVPLAILPVLMSAARVAVNDHYVSDVLASAALAAVVTWLFAHIVLERGLRRDGVTAVASTSPTFGATPMIDARCSESATDHRSMRGNEASSPKIQLPIERSGRAADAPRVDLHPRE